MKTASLPPKLHRALSELDRGLADLYGERYRGLVLYGSYARGDAHEGSDVDLLLLLEGPVDSSRELIRTGDVAWPIGLETDLLLAVMPVGIDRFRSSREPVIWNAREEGVTVP